MIFYYQKFLGYRFDNRNRIIFNVLNRWMSAFLPFCAPEKTIICVKPLLIYDFLLSKFLGYRFNNENRIVFDGLNRWMSAFLGSYNDINDWWKEFECQ